MRVMFRFNLITTGSEIEPMPQAVASEEASQDSNQFRARIGQPPGREVIWLKDNNTYSLSALSVKLEEHGLYWFRPRTFELWRLVGAQESLWDLAERMLRQESEKDK